MLSNPLIKELMSIEGAHIADEDGFNMTLCEEEAKVIAKWMRNYMIKDGVCLMCPPKDEKRPATEGKLVPLDKMKLAEVFKLYAYEDVMPDGKQCFVADIDTFLEVLCNKFGTKARPICNDECDCGVGECKATDCAPAVKVPTENELLGAMSRADNGVQHESYYRMLATAILRLLEGK